MSRAGSTGTHERSHIIMCEQPKGDDRNYHKPRTYFTNFELPFDDSTLFAISLIYAIDGIETITVNRYSIVVAKGRLFEWEDIEDAFLLELTEKMRFDPSDVLIKQDDVNGIDASRLLRNST